MQTIANPKTKSKFLIPESIANLDLEMILRKLMLPEPEGKGWTRDMAELSKLWYQRFLTLNLKYPDAEIVPNHVIDTLWHYHILDTRKYVKDCEQIFGRMLHHYPYFGLFGDHQELELAFDETNRLYRIEFGEDCTQLSNNMASCKDW